MRNQSMSKERILIVLWTSGRCNLKCKYCYADTRKQQHDMDFPTAVKVLEYFGDTPLKIQFAGGEPLLNYALICRIDEYIRRHGYDVQFQLQTNGTLIDQEIAAKIKRMQIAVGVSLDGPPEVNEMLRGGTKSAVNGIRKLAQAGINININSVVTAENVERLPELVDFSVYLGNVKGIGLDLIRFAGERAGSLCSLHAPGAEALRTALFRLHQRSEASCVKVPGSRSPFVRLRRPKEDFLAPLAAKTIVMLPVGDPMWYCRRVRSIPAAL